MSRGLRGACFCFKRGKTNAGEVYFPRILESAPSSDWHCEFWERLCGPKVPRALHKGQLSVDMAEEDNFRIHCLEQQLPKNMKPDTVQAGKVTLKEIKQINFAMKAPLH